MTRSKGRHCWAARPTKSCIWAEGSALEVADPWTSSPTRCSQPSRRCLRWLSLRHLTTGGFQRHSRATVSRSRSSTRGGWTSSDSYRAALRCPTIPSCKPYCDGIGVSAACTSRVRWSLSGWRPRCSCLGRRYRFPFRQSQGMTNGPDQTPRPAFFALSSTGTLHLRSPLVRQSPRRLRRRSSQ